MRSRGPLPTIPLYGRITASQRVPTPVTVFSTGREAGQGRAHTGLKKEDTAAPHWSEKGGHSRPTGLKNRYNNLIETEIVGQNPEKPVQKPDRNRVFEDKNLIETENAWTKT